MILIHLDPLFIKYFWKRFIFRGEINVQKTLQCHLNAESSLKGQYQEICLPFFGSKDSYWDPYEQAKKFVRIVFAKIFDCKKFENRVSFSGAQLSLFC